MWLSVLLLLSLCSFPFASSLACYQSPDWNSTALEISPYCSATIKGVEVVGLIIQNDCCVKSDDSHGWMAEACLSKVSLGNLQKSTGCFIDESAGTTTCCCDTDKCNGIGSSTYKNALNRQHCFEGEDDLSCNDQLPLVTGNRRCHQDVFSCYMEANADGKGLSIVYRCRTGHCEEYKCYSQRRYESCCCEGNNCNNQTLARAMRDRVCPTTTTTTTTSTTTSTTTTTTTVPTTTLHKEPGTTEDSSGGLSGGIIALIVVASPLGLLVIVIGVAFIVKAIRQCINKQQEEI